MLVVTTNEIQGWELQRVCGEVYGVSVRMPADPSNPADNRSAAVLRMLEQVRAKGGNAAVGLRFDSASLGDGRVEICAYATAIVAAPADDGARQTATLLGYGAPAAADEQAREQEPTQAPEAEQPAQQPAAQPIQQPWQQYPPQQPPYGQPQQPQQQPWGGPQGFPQQQPGYPPQQYPQGYPGPQ